MTLAYLDFSKSGNTGAPAVREYNIFNTGMILIRDLKEKTGKEVKQQTIKADVYEAATLFKNIQDILRSDTCDSQILSAKTQMTDIRFILVYSPEHSEACSPLACNEKGVSILSLIDGFVTYAKQDHTYYNWYEVSFNKYDSKSYSYFYEDDSIQVGDHVLVPTGHENKETPGIVVNFWRVSEEHLPYPKEKTKWIIRKIEKEKPAQ